MPQGPQEKRRESPLIINIEFLIALHAAVLLSSGTFSTALHRSHTWAVSGALCVSAEKIAFYKTKVGEHLIGTPV